MSRLSAIDAFFVAHQEASGVPMLLEAEAALAGPVTFEQVERAAAALLARWPHLGRTLRRRWLGLAWSGPEGEVARRGEAAALREWRERPIDPFREPPFGVLWVPGEGAAGGTLALRVHHAACDGEAFLGLARRLLDQLAGAPEAESPEPPDPYRLRELWARRRLGPMLRHVRALQREARGGRAARLAVRSCELGPVDVVGRTLAAGERARLREQARAGGVTPAAVAAAAWARALGRWNAAQGAGGPRRVTLEVPVSARSGSELPLGNRVAPLVIEADPDRPLLEVARGVRAQLRDGLRARAHLAVPLLTAPGALLAYRVLRRLAEDPTWSGFATSHFTWVERADDLDARLRARSGGALELAGLRLQTPVCLHMGAGLCGLAGPDEVRLFLAYRMAALAPEQATALMELLLEEALGVKEEVS